MHNYPKDLENCPQEKVDHAVLEHINWIQSAVMDAASGGFLHEMTHEEIVEKECEADQLYDDPDTLESFIGDYIPLNKGSFGTFRVLYAFHKHGHLAMKEAAERIASRWC